MLRRLFIHEELAARVEAMRRVHSQWLTRALRARSGPAIPRIPTRLVSQGGFDALLATPQGRAWADQFWAGTLDLPDLG